MGTVIGTLSGGTMMSMVSTMAYWLGAPAADKASAFTLAAGVGSVCLAVTTMYIIAEWLALVFLGIGMARSQVYPKWLGWAALILGAVNVAVAGIPQFFNGLTGTTQTVFSVVVILSGIWALMVGIWVARKAW